MERSEGSGGTGAGQRNSSRLRNASRASRSRADDDGRAGRRARGSSSLLGAAVENRAPHETRLERCPLFDGWSGSARARGENALAVALVAATRARFARVRTGETRACAERVSASARRRGRPPLPCLTRARKTKIATSGGRRLDERRERAARGRDVATRRPSARERGRGEWNARTLRSTRTRRSVRVEWRRGSFAAPSRRRACSLAWRRDSLRRLRIHKDFPANPPAAQRSNRGPSWTVPASPSRVPRAPRARRAIIHVRIHEGRGRRSTRASRDARPGVRTPRSLGATLARLGCARYRGTRRSQGGGPSSSSARSGRTT